MTGRDSGSSAVRMAAKFSRLLLTRNSICFARSRTFLRNFAQVTISVGIYWLLTARFFFADSLVSTPANTPVERVASRSSWAGNQMVCSSSRRANRRFKEVAIPSFSTISSARATLPVPGATCGRWYLSGFIFSAKRRRISSSGGPESISSISAPTVLAGIWQNPAGAAATLYQMMLCVLVPFPAIARCTPRNHSAMPRTLSPRYIESERSKFTVSAAVSVLYTWIARHKVRRSSAFSAMT